MLSQTRRRDRTSNDVGQEQYGVGFTDRELGLLLDTRRQWRSAGDVRVALAGHALRLLLDRRCNAASIDQLHVSRQNIDRDQQAPQPNADACLPACLPRTRTGIVQVLRGKYVMP